jgi:hypothetical protein
VSSPLFKIHASHQQQDYSYREKDKEKCQKLRKKGLTMTPVSEEVNDSGSDEHMQIMLRSLQDEI